MSIRDILTGCQNPHGCRKVAIKRVQAGHMDESVHVEYDLELCAYCVDSFEQQYRAEHPDGFVREVPREE
jgi:hypothetical protein